MVVRSILRDEIQSHELDVWVGRAEDDEWLPAEANQSIGTLALATCTGIAVRNNSTRRKFVGHFTFPEEGRAQEMLDAALINAHPSLLSVWVRGCAPVFETADPLDIELRDTSRSFVRNLLVETGIQRFDIIWNDLPFSSVDMMLRGTKSALEYSVTPY